MAKSLGKNLTEGSIPRHLLSLAVPMLLSNLIATGYSIVDAIWVGRFVGRDALGAVAASAPVVFIFVGVAAGATMATTVLVSQFYGARNFEMAGKVINVSFALSIILSIISTVGGILAAGGILRALGTPPEVFPYAVPYLKITFLSFPVQYMIFLVTSILRGVGDTKTPLYFMMVGFVINAILDPLMIIGIGPFPTMGLNGAAWATVISSSVALALGVAYLRRKGGALVAGINFRRLDFRVAKLIIKIGLPSMIQQSSIAFGMAAVTFFVNSFGAVAIAAFGAAGRIDAVIFLPAQSIGLAVAAISGQNIGAGRYDRIHGIFKWGLLMTLSISLFFSILFLTIPGVLLAPFTTDPDVIAIGSGCLRILGPSITFLAVMLVSNGVINGAGHTLTTLIFTLIAVWGLRIPGAAILSRGSMGITGIWVSYAIAFCVMMCVSLLWYRSGRWKKPVVKHDVNAVFD
ncbi:MAG: MATE family efflux transporter [Chitinispirillales bacterium]|jgi:putative MATE family efflux protein|nr:MATE family efflux transporter [Chitinispirillales bacterium]